MIVFLDIDGPVIPNSMFLTDYSASQNRHMSNTAVGLVNWVCNKSGAKVVTNSSHNISGQPLKDSLIEYGLEEKNIHDQWHTTYGISSENRMKAIEYWMQKNHVNCKWVCFDDFQFTKNHNLILIDPDDGILLKHAKLALTKFGVPNNTILF